jgi:HPt (histidine-containing phosphotransfer) domain-containing protein
MVWFAKQLIPINLIPSIVAPCVPPVVCPCVYRSKNINKRCGQNVKAVMSSSINLAELLNRVDNDRELLVELFSIFKTEFPTHVQFLSEAISRVETKRVETESHILKGMLLNLSASRAAAIASELESMARENKIDDVKLAFTELQREAKALLLRMDECLVEFQL